MQWYTFELKWWYIIELIFTDLSVTSTRYPLVLLNADTSKMFYWGAVSDNYAERVNAEKEDWNKKIEEERAASVKAQKDYDTQKGGTKVLNALVGGSGRPGDYVAPKPTYLAKIYDNSCSLTRI